MRPPASFTLAYLKHRKIGEELQRLAGPRILNVCQASDRAWLFDHRVKGEESALAKLQLGPVSSLTEMNDIYAATIVVPTSGEVPTAVKALQEQFPKSDVVKRKRPRAETFIYDDTHVLARLADHASGLDDALKERVFEVQIKSGLQFAWWRATHDVLYKGAERSWRLSRVAGQIRAALELLDNQLSDLRRSADAAGPPEADDLDQGFSEIAGLLDSWDRSQRPEDISRFVQSVHRVLKAARLEAAGMPALLETELGRKLVENPEVTPLQAILAVAVNAKGPEMVDRFPTNPYVSVLVTAELIDAAPFMSAVPEGRRVRLA